MFVYFIVSDLDFKMEINNICLFEIIFTKLVDILFRVRVILIIDIDDFELNLIVILNY